VTVWDDPRLLGDCDVIEAALIERWRSPTPRMVIPEREERPDYMSHCRRPCCRCGKMATFRYHQLRKHDYRCKDCISKRKT